jgi:hypothetical protein
LFSRNFGFFLNVFLKGWGTQKSHLLDVTQLGKEKTPPTSGKCFSYAKRGKENVLNG